MGDFPHAGPYPWSYRDLRQRKRPSSSERDATSNGRLPRQRSVHSRTQNESPVLDGLSGRTTAVQPQSFSSCGLRSAYFLGPCLGLDFGARFSGRSVVSVVLAGGAGEGSNLELERRGLQLAFFSRALSKGSPVARHGVKGRTVSLSPRYQAWRRKEKM